VKDRILAGMVLVLLVAACGGSTATASPNVVAPSVAIPSAVTAPPSAPASTTPKPSATAAPTSAPSVASSAASACMDKAAVELLVTNLVKLQTLTADQLASIVVALKASNDPASAKWRQQVAADIESKDWAAAASMAGPLVTGQVTLKKCP